MKKELVHGKITMDNVGEGGGMIKKVERFKHAQGRVRLNEWALPPLLQKPLAPPFHMPSVPLPPMPFIPLLPPLLLPPFPRVPGLPPVDSP